VRLSNTNQRTIHTPERYGCWVELRHLRSVVAVAEELHFGRAAERLHISQAPLSAQIQRIEREVGHQLFERTTRSVRLTPVGAELYRRAVEILERVDRTIPSLQQVAEGRAGGLRVGFVSSASYSVLPHAVRRFRDAAPLVDLDLVPLTSAAQVDRLHDGELDLGVLRGAAPGGLPTEQIYQERLVACLPADWPLARREVVTPEEISGEPMISFPSADMPGYLEEIRPVFDGVPLPVVRARVVHQETALGFVAAGLGFTVLPESVSTFMPASVQAVALAGNHRTTVRAAWPTPGLSPAAERFLAALRPR
jgi:DNA-binding transcriptional LysR family regulator